jgi:hypothetical protein
LLQAVRVEQLDWFGRDAHRRPWNRLPPAMLAHSWAPHLSSRLKGRTAEGQSAWLKAASSWLRQGTAFFTTAASPCMGERGEWGAGSGRSNSS